MKEGAGRQGHTRSKVQCLHVTLMWADGVVVDERVGGHSGVGVRLRVAPKAMQSAAAAAARGYGVVLPPTIGSAGWPTSRAARAERCSER